MDQQQDRQVTFQDYLRILYRGRWIILISFLTVVGFVTYYTFTMTPIYRSTVKVMIKDNSGVQQALFNVVDFMEKEKKINNQVEILNSSTLAESVIKRLMSSEEADRLYILGYDPENRLSGFSVKKAFQQLFDEGSNNARSSQDEASPQPLLPREYEQKLHEIIRQLQSNMSVEPIRNTDMIRISVTAPSPTEAAYIANTIAQVYKEQNQLASQEEVRKVKDFLGEQLSVFQEQLRESEQALKEYKEREKFVALPREVDELVTKLAEVEKLYREAEVELNSNRERLSYIDEQLGASKKNLNMQNILTAPFLNELNQKMVELETQKTRYIASVINHGVYDPNDPNILKFNEQAKLLEEKLRAGITQLAAAETGDPITLSEELFQRKIEVEATIQALLPKVEALKKIVAEYNQELEKIPERSLKLARLERAARLDEKITLMMKEKYEETRITEVGQLGNVRIIDPAKPDYVPIKPKKQMNILLGIVMGLGLGIAMTFILEYFDNSVRSAADIERLGIPILGAIPVIRIEDTNSKLGNNGKHRLSDHANAGEAKAMVSRLITHFAPKSPISEAYRSLRTSIQYARADSPLKTIVITSPGPQEGKSTTVANLAITIAQMGTKTLLVDTDLRRPILHSIFNINRSKGISNYLIGKADLDEVIFKTEIDNLFVIPSGTLPPNPSELLGSVSMKQCISELKKRFDVVLFDSPPIMAVTDAAVISSEVDGVILVVKAGQTDRNAVQRSFEILRSIPNRILGALLNVVSVDGVYGSYYYYYYHYYYYGKDGIKHHRRSKSRS
ncbi:MAG: polysaccharide biosynthesis tyrosine autokinase [candidate division KSB1 bacterium]|nr:polysaccharide biosynthesis tyrosine autokinase [candidate division KSB1 bacterium]MDZ7334441.1 polysaccharide biosynthesis tyrosine autokinase [candidate division KSB1 bacterium]MDZ7355968.1 polysaccharide biosynthesis tyrosine autokinase [candidate division KSB1 bacterium]MDZ7375464.1 polysaccharide biosynthesis tyrosine autokinase [candidate division KSB1 bacterium]MDZ7400698.1 polysaccharide biosynthesis tyrosine autokinase [candidate division KSB1 bacterium]